MSYDRLHDLVRLVHTLMVKSRPMKAIRLLVLGLFTFACLLGASRADDLTASVVAELQWRDANTLSDVSYLVKETTKDNTIEYRTHVLKNEAQRHTLLSVNGKAATEKEAAVFAKERDTMSDAKPKDDDKDGLLALIKPGSISYVSETDTTALFSFVAVMDFDGKIIEMDGKLSYDLKGCYVDTFSIQNRDTFKPDSKVKIKTFIMSMEFVRNEELGHVVPTLMFTKVKGTAMLVVGIDEEAKVSISDYRRET